MGDPKTCVETLNPLGDPKIHEGPQNLWGDPKTREVPPPKWVPSPPCSHSGVMLHRDRGELGSGSVLGALGVLGGGALGRDDEVLG